VVPDLDDLPGVTEAKDVDAGELGLPPCRRNPGPRASVSARRCPPRSDQVSLRQEEIEPPLEVGERLPERASDLGLSLRSRRGQRRPKVVPNVVVREHLLGEGHIPARPNLLVELRHKSLVRLGIHCREDPTGGRVAATVPWPCVRERHMKVFTGERRLSRLLLSRAPGGSLRLALGGRPLDPRLERGVHLLEPDLGLCQQTTE
jgi:hypothetical protein